MIHVPRYGVGNGLRSTFWPRCFRRDNCQLSHLFLHKWRGVRRNQRLERQARREHLVLMAMNEMIRVTMPQPGERAATLQAIKEYLDNSKSSTSP